MIVLVFGTIMYVVEGPGNGFTDIPTSIYWAISTVTTVGFGDITPKTDFGRLIASVMMLIGWGTLAVPTGIVTAEMTARRHALHQGLRRVCEQCGAREHLAEAAFCQSCGGPLPPPDKA
jgi:voltage-gated potassium channel